MRLNISGQHLGLFAWQGILDKAVCWSDKGVHRQLSEMYASTNKRSLYVVLPVNTTMSQEMLQSGNLLLLFDFYEWLQTSKRA